MSMEKYGVQCGCAQGRPPPPSSMIKTASGEKKCSDCGRVWDKEPPPEAIPIEAQDEKS